jgi:hypothetical protein
MEQLDDLLAGAEVALDDDVLDQIDAVAPPGTYTGPMRALYDPPAVGMAGLRRRPINERPALALGPP